MVAAAKVALEHVADRVGALEAVAGDLADRMEQRPPDLGAAVQEADGSEAVNGASGADGADGATRRAPKREPRDTPDLR
jgi:hypothetical protein